MLVICTAFKTAYVAVKFGKDVRTKVFDANAKASEAAMPVIEELLENRKVSDLQTIGVVVGPGSFTGVRIGVSLALGMMAANPHIKAVNISARELLSKAGIAATDDVFEGKEDLPDGNVFELFCALLSLTENGEKVGANELRPVYLRPSQAESEFLKEKIVLAVLNDVVNIAKISDCKFTMGGWTKQQIEDSLKSKNNKCFLLKKEGKVLAYLNTMFTGDEIEILTIASSEERKGYGTKLLTHIESFKKPIFLEVSDKNKRAILFYQKNGFKQIGVRKNYYDDNSDALIFKKGSTDR